MALRCSGWNLDLFLRIWGSEQFINSRDEQRGLIAFYNSDSDPSPSLVLGCGLVWLMCW
jgi:hypothetical protein